MEQRIINYSTRFNNDYKLLNKNQKSSVDYLVNIIDPKVSQNICNHHELTKFNKLGWKVMSFDLPTNKNEIIIAKSNTDALYNRDSDRLVYKYIYTKDNKLIINLMNYKGHNYNNISYSYND